MTYETFQGRFFCCGGWPGGAPERRPDLLWPGRGEGDEQAGHDRRPLARVRGHNEGRH